MPQKRHDTTSTRFVEELGCRREGGAGHFLPTIDEKLFASFGVYAEYCSTAIDLVAAPAGSYGVRVAIDLRNDLQRDAAAVASAVSQASHVGHLQ